MYARPVAARGKVTAGASLIACTDYGSASAPVLPTDRSVDAKPRTVDTGTMRSRVPALSALLFLVSACAAPDHRDLAAATTFELARSHGRYVEVNGLDTFAIVAGEGPDVVLLHGDLSSSYTWRHLIEPLMQAHRVHAVDLPGHGFSVKPDDAPYTTTWQAGHVADYLKAAGVTKAAFIGSSMGGEVASEIAALFPRLTSSLVLISPAGLPSTERIAPRPWLRILGYPCVGWVAARLPFRGSLAQLLRDAYYDPTLVADTDIEAYYAPLRAQHGMSAFLARARQASSVDRTQIVARIRVPTLVIVGEIDRLVPHAVSRRYESLIEGSRTIVIDRAGHLAQEERPEAVFRAIDGWLAAHGK